MKTKETVQLEIDGKVYITDGKTIKLKSSKVGFLSVEQLSYTLQARIKNLFSDKKS